MKNHACLMEGGERNSKAVDRGGGVIKFCFISLNLHPPSLNNDGPFTGNGNPATFCATCSNFNHKIDQVL